MIPSTWFHSRSISFATALMFASFRKSMTSASISAVKREPGSAQGTRSAELPVEARRQRPNCSRAPHPYFFFVRGELDARHRPVRRDAQDRRVEFLVEHPPSVATAAPRLRKPALLPARSRNISSLTREPESLKPSLVRSSARSAIGGAVQIRVA